MVWQAIDRDIGEVWRASVDADDVMQVTYLEAFLAMDRMTATDERGFVSWLRRAAKNNLRDAIKELGRKKRPPPNKRVKGVVGEAESYVSLVGVLGATSETPSRIVAHDEAAMAIQSVLSRMPDDYATVIRMYDIEGSSIGEVAESMNRSSGAVHMLRARAHDCLRKMLGSETDFFSDHR